MDGARFLLILHAVIGAALVAASTHLVVWTWGLRRGTATRWRGVRILAGVSLSLYVAVFALGNFIYPAYKQHVRIEYFEDTPSVRAEAQARLDAAQRDAKRRGDARTIEAPIELPQLGAVAKVFDIKEHWVALGLALSAAAFALAWAWDPRRGPSASEAPRAGHLLMWLAFGAAGCAWIGALVGLWVTSFRSVGALT